MNKEEKIKSEYIKELSKDMICKNDGKKFYNKLKPYINKDGWIDATNSKGYCGYLMESDMETKFPLTRLKSLQGIEDNNGWIKIESEEDLPEPEQNVLWLNNENYDMELSSILTCGFDCQDYTHWQPLPEKPPIY